MNQGTTIDVQLKPVKLGAAYGDQHPKLIPVQSGHLLNLKDSDHVSTPLKTPYEPRTPPPTPVDSNLFEIDRIFAKGVADICSYSAASPVAQAFPGRNTKRDYEMKKDVLLYLLIFALAFVFGFLISFYLV